MAARCTIVTTCKGRLAHLQRSLPTFAAQADTSVVVVDYDCPDGTAAWVREHCPAVHVERVDNAPVFNLSRARNIGARAVRTPWLLFCDADNELPEGFSDALAAYLASNVFARPFTYVDGEAVAVPFPLACETEVYWRVGGFDDAMEGWGAEDWEFVERLLAHGIAERTFPVSLVRLVDHPDAERTRFYASAMPVSRVVNHLYARIKLRYLHTRQRLLTDAQRHGTYAQVKSAVLASIADPSLQAPFDIRIPQSDPPWTGQLVPATIRNVYASAARPSPAR